jgi:hypothetical protein
MTWFAMAPPPKIEGPITRVVIPKTVPVSITTRNCLTILKYPLEHDAKKTEDDISDALEPLIKFVVALVDTHSRLAERSKHTRVSYRDLYTETKKQMPKIRALAVFTGFFARWGIEVTAPGISAQVTEQHGISEDTILME